MLASRRLSALAREFDWANRSHVPPTFINWKCAAYYFMRITAENDANFAGPEADILQGRPGLDRPKCRSAPCYRNPFEDIAFTIRRAANPASEKVLELATRLFGPW